MSESVASVEARRIHCLHDPVVGLTDLAICMSEVPNTLVDNLDADGEGIDVQLFEDTSQLKQHALAPHRQRRSAGLSDHRSATISVDQGGNLVIDAGANETGAEHLLKVGALEVQGAFSIPNHPNIADSLTMLAKNSTVRNCHHYVATYTVSHDLL